MEETPKELDWVNSRANCELETAFQELREAVEKDVVLYNLRFDLHDPHAIAFQTNDPYPLFSVFRKTHAGIVSTAFHKKSNEIEIEDQCGAQKLSAIPIFTANGRCKFQIGGEELEQWQLRRKALEAIFFRPTPR